MRCRKRGEEGIVLIAFAIAAAIVIGALGMTIDLGRMHVVKTESQSFVDGVALQAALELDGTRAGLDRAAGAAMQSTQKYDLGQYPYREVTTRFATGANGPWLDASAASPRSRFVRVTAIARPRLFFLPVLVTFDRATVASTAAAAQLEKSVFREGLFPFSPVAPLSNASVNPPFGLAPGKLYPLRWPAGSSLLNNGGRASQLCSGDRAQPTPRRAAAHGGGAQGYIELGNAGAIRRAILNGSQSAARTIGGIIDFTGGDEQTMLDALQTRIRQDTDPSSLTYSQYANGARGNGRRIVGVPINDGGATPGAKPRMIGAGAFFLRPAGEYGAGGDSAWCAEYIGSYVEGSARKGAEDSGAWVVRLVQ